MIISFLIYFLNFLFFICFLILFMNYFFKKIKMNREKELAKKYAYNINSKDMIKNIDGSGIDVESLKKGFYDEIFNKENRIKKNKMKLKILKNNLFKEFIYTHREIPLEWKNKIEYKNQILNIVSKDENFIKYIGRGNIRTNSEKKISKYSFKDNKDLNNISEKNNKILKPTLSTFSDCLFTSESNSNIKSKTNNLSQFDDSNKINFTIGNSKNRNLSVLKLKKLLQKDVKTILDEHNEKFPIIEMFKKEVGNIDINNRKNECNNNFSRSLSNFTLIPKSLKTTMNSFQNISNFNKGEKSILYKQGIFSNLIPENNKINLKSYKSKSTTNINKQFQKNEFLNNEYSNTNNYFFKKIEITDPIKKKFLEKINYAGPYFPYCPPCANKNLQFYQNMSRDNCINIATFIHKSRSNEKNNKTVT